MVSSEQESLQVDRSGDTITIWLNRPERRNVLTRGLIKELTRTFADAGESEATGVILAARGPVFCAGHDFSEMAGIDQRDVRRLFEKCTRLMTTIQSIPQPVVAMVQGLATGAGCQLVATADLAVASDEARFCTPGGRGGLFCTTPLVAVGRSIARKRALEMAMSGDEIDARTAASWGLINEVVPAAELEGATAALLHRVTRGSPASKGIGKHAFYAQIDQVQSDAYDYATEVMAAASQIPDAQESMASFLEKRAPSWTESPRTTTSRT